MSRRILSCRRLGAALLAGALVASGCAGRHEPSAPSRPHVTKLPDSRDWDPLADAAASHDELRPLIGAPTFDEVRAAAAGGPSRADGEQYAILVAQLLTDVRPKFRGEDVMRLVEAPEMNHTDRAYVVDDLDLQAELGWQRQIDTTADLWIRSRPSGPVGAPRSLDVEVLAFSVAPPADARSWISLRLDVVRHGGRWQLAAFVQGGASTTEDRHLTPEKNPIALPGTGWRRIPPAGP